MMRKTFVFIMAILLTLSTAAVASPLLDWKSDSVCTNLSSMSYYVTAVSGGTEKQAQLKTQTIGYTSNGLRLQDIRYDASGKQSAIYLYNYIDLPNRTLLLDNIVEYNAAKQLVAIETLNYDQKANGILTVVKTDSNDKFISKTIYYENSKGYDVLAETYNANSVLIKKVETVYNSNDDIILLTEMDLLTGVTTVTKTDYNGSKITSQTISYGSNLIVNKYYYDIDNNWDARESYISKDGSTNESSLELFEITRRLFIPYG